MSIAAPGVRARLGRPLRALLPVWRAWSTSPFAQVLFLLLPILVLQLHWILRDDSLIGVDVANHLLYATNFHDRFLEIWQTASISFSDQVLQTFHLMMNPVRDSTLYWPNGFNLTVLPFMTIFGRTLLAAKLTQVFYLFVLLLATYRLGNILGGHRAGLASVLVLFAYPLVFLSSRQTNLDLPLAAVVVLATTFLVKDDLFSRWVPSLGFGAVLCWALLLKGQALIYLSGPVLVHLYLAVRHLRFQRLLKLALVGTIACGLLWSWWVKSLPTALLFLNDHIFAAEKAVESAFSWEEKYSLSSMTYYLRSSWSLLGPHLAILALPAILTALAHSPLRNLLVVQFLPAVLVLSLVFTIKQGRFLLPLCPLLATCTGTWLVRLKPGTGTKIVGILVLAFSCYQFVGYSYLPREQRTLGPLQTCPSTEYETPPPELRTTYHQGLKTLSAQMLALHGNLSSPVDVALYGLMIDFWSLLRLTEPRLSISSGIYTHPLIRDNLETLDFVLVNLPPGHDLRALNEAELRALAALHVHPVGHKGRDYYLDNLRELVRWLHRDFELVHAYPPLPGYTPFSGIALYRRHTRSPTASSASPLDR